MFSTSSSRCLLCRGYKSSASMQVTLTASLQVMSMPLPATNHESTRSYNMLDSTGCLCRWAIYLLPCACIAILLLYECCAFELVLLRACSVGIYCHAILTLCNLLLKSRQILNGFRQVTAWRVFIVSLHNCSLLAWFQDRS